MRENLPQWEFVIGAYAVCIIGVVALVVWSWASMRKAEKRREEVRKR